MRTQYDEITGVWVRTDGTVKNDCCGRGWSFGTPFTVNDEIRHYVFSPKLYRQVWVHRIVARAFCFKPKAYNLVDHIDGNSQNNCAANLRYLDHTLNNLNRKHARNVSYDKRYKRWRARVRVRGGTISLGGFKYFRHAYLHAQAYKELLFNAIYLLELSKHERQEAQSCCYLHGSKTNFDLATELLDTRSGRSSNCRRALFFIRDLRAQFDHKRPSFS